MLPKWSAQVQTLHFFVGSWLLSCRESFTGDSVGINILRKLPCTCKSYLLATFPAETGVLNAGLQLVMYNSYV